MEAILSTPSAIDRAARYRDLADEIASVVAGEPNQVARMATVVAMLTQGFDHFFWTGFYIVDSARPNELVVGPYQGTLGCLRIAMGRGVCGAAAARRETVIVEDVHEFPDHIACDTRSRSEIVVPVLDLRGHLIAVLDVDATETGAFDAIDAENLEAILRQTFAS